LEILTYPQFLLRDLNFQINKLTNVLKASTLHAAYTVSVFIISKKPVYIVVIDVCLLLAQH